MPRYAIWHHGTWSPLLPPGSKPLPEPMLTDHQESLVAFTWGHFDKKCSTSIGYMSFKITILRSLLHLLRASELSVKILKFFLLLKYWCCHCILQLLYAWPSRRSIVSSDDKIAIYFLKTAQVAGSTSQPRVSRCHQFQVWMPYHSELLYWLMVATDIDDGWGWGEVTGITWRDQTCSLDYWEKFMLKSMLFNKYFSNMASDWLAGAASQSEARFEIFC